MICTISLLDKYFPAESEKIWQATGQSNLAYERLIATKASKVWFSYSHSCALANEAAILTAKFDCPVARQNFSLLATAHDCETGLLSKSSKAVSRYAKSMVPQAAQALR